MTGKVIIFSAPSGAGKSTVVGHLLKLHPEFEFSISATSRPPRGRERDGVEYYFITADRFRQLIAEDAFVEHEEVYRDRFYGTLKSEVARIWEKGHVIIFDVDVKGLPPSMEVLEQRLRHRGTDSEDAIRERLGKASSEIAFARGRFDREIVNDRLDETFVEAERIVDGFLCG